ncbi:MAG: CHASE2 domain-containing protein [bacterium]|nr:CHASE2 domain-containing protein [bacterium]
MAAFWRRVPGFWQNFIAGLLIIGALLSLDRTAVVKHWEDWAVDIMIRLNSSLDRMTGERRGRTDLQFTFLDMDEHSFRDKSWNEPFHVPRDKVLKLIEFAVEGKASIIVVDVNFSKKGTDPDADRALVDYVANYPSSAPPLILMRAKRNQEGSGSADLGEFRKTIFAGIKHSNVHFAQPLFRRDRHDGVVRSWILFDQGCFGGQGLSVPSVQLLSYALLKDRHGGGRQNLLDLDASMSANAPTTCNSSKKLNYNLRPVILGKTVFRQQRLGERLIYSIPWPKSSHVSSDLATIPAVFVTDRGFKNYEEVTDRITLIGASYGASHDLHLTPLGLMPGTLIILNAIKSLSLFDQIQPPPLYIRLAFLITFITVLSYVFSKYSNVIKLLVISTMVFVFFVPISFWFFKYGVWFDFGILLLGIKLQHTASEFLEVRELKRLRSELLAFKSNKSVSGDSQSVSVPAEFNYSDPDEMEVQVRLKRNKDGSFRVKAFPAGLSSAEFEIAPQGLKKKQSGYVLDLKRHGSSS